MDDTIHRSYEGFAYVYDTFMDNVPYEEWAEYVTGILEEYGITDGLVLDLGCGTGSMTELLAEKGYDMIGVDLSADMLEIAGRQGAVWYHAGALSKAGHPHHPLYLRADTRLEPFDTGAYLARLAERTPAGQRG